MESQAKRDTHYDWIDLKRVGSDFPRLDRVRYLVKTMRQGSCYKSIQHLITQKSVHVHLSSVVLEHNLLTTVSLVV